MTEYVKKILTGQFEAALSMLKDCIEQCPPEHWDGVVGKYPFWQVAYHVLCFVDLYLSPNEGSFQLGKFHPQGMKELDDEYPSRRFDKRELAEYLEFCHRKAIASIAAETGESLEGPSGHSHLQFSRGELHIYNLRHVQHHVGQLNAFLRRFGPAFQDIGVLRWARTGWQ
jgi:hypothetical protein